MRDTKQATNEQQEPIDEGSKNSTSLPQPTTPSLTSRCSMMTMYLIGVGLMTSSNMSDIKRIGDRV